MGRRGGRAMAVVTTVAMLAAGCGDESTVKGSDDAAAWRTSTDPVTTSGLAWAADSTVHLADGTTIDTGGYVRMFVVAGDGVFFVRAETEEDAGDTGFGEAALLFAAPGQPVTDTGLKMPADYLGVSSDGRYLAAIDPASGRKDNFGTPQASVVAFDLQTGEQVVDSTMGMGDPDKDDLAVSYSESEMEITAVTDATLYVRATAEVVFDLTTGEARLAEKGEAPAVAGDQLASPDGAWRIEKPETGVDRVVATDGHDVALDTGTPRWMLSWWADAETAVGVTFSGPGTGKRVEPGDTAALMTCAVPTGECQVFPETAGQTVVFPVGQNRPEAFVLPGGGPS